MKFFYFLFVFVTYSLVGATPSQPPSIEFSQAGRILSQVFQEKEQVGTLSAETNSKINEILRSWAFLPGTEARAVAKEFLFLNFYADVLTLKQQEARTPLSGQIRLLENEMEKTLFQMKSDQTGVERFFARSKETVNSLKKELLKQKQSQTLQLHLLLSEALNVVSPGEGDEAVPSFKTALSSLEENQVLKSVFYTQKAWRALFPGVLGQIQDRELIQLLHLKIAVAYLKHHSQSDPEIENLLREIENGVGPLSQKIQHLALALKAPLENLGEDQRREIQSLLAPQNGKARLVEELEFYRQILKHAETNALKKVGFIAWVRGYPESLKDAFSRLDRKLKETAQLLQDEDEIRVVHQAAKDMHWISLLLGNVLDQLPFQSKLAFEYANSLAFALDDLGRGRSVNSSAFFQKLRTYILQERGEGIYRAWINRRNASTLSVSTLLLAEAIAIPFSGGATTTAMPATLHLLTTGATAGAKTYLVMDSALRIADRVTNEGAMGLAHLDTGFDVLVILSLSPRPVPGASVPSTTLEKVVEQIKTTTARVQYSAGILATAGGGLYGGYLVLNADAISQALEKEEGLLVSAREIRRRGFLDLAFAVLAATANQNAYQKGVKEGGATFEAKMEDVTATAEMLKFYRRVFHPVQNIQEFRTNHPGVFGGVGALGLSAYTAAQYYVMFNEAGLFYFSNLDSNYLNHAVTEAPLPELRPGETAVVMVGFEKSDYFLYQGIHSNFSHHREIGAFGKKNVFVYDYLSPEDFVSVLREHRRLHGPIRYLKVATHGRPGRLFSPNVGAIPEAEIRPENDGWITEPWIRARGPSLQNFARKTFADDARVIFWSCLTGANLDRDQGDGKDVGERFIKTFGDHFLVNGGKVQASTRVLVGLESAVGPAYRDLLMSEYQTLNTDEKEELAVVLGFPSLLLGEGSREEAEGPLPVLGRLGSRIWNFISSWPPYWVTYGMELEGPFWWQGSYRSMDFPKK